MAAASPPPNAAAGRPHPTYTKMITHALTELGGDSPRPAIAEYILARFSGLPDRHDHLLSAHLRRLVSEGVIRTHGPDSPSYSYIFHPPPPSEGTPVPVSVPVETGGGEKRGRGRPRKNPHTQTCGIAPPSVLLPAKRKLPGPGEDDPSLSKRGPGRPATHQSAHIQEALGNLQNGGRGASSTGIKRGRGRPRKEKPPPGAAGIRPEESGNAATTTAVKRGRGRPRKEKRGPGRPRKEKRGPGRPRKEKPPPGAARIPPESGNAATTTVVKRGPGRPRKQKPSQEAQSATASRGFKRGCGRPSIRRPSASYPHGVAASVGINTGGGTPRKDMPAAAISAQTSMEKLAAAAAAMYAETRGDTAAASAAVQAGGWQSRIEKLAALPAEVKRNRGRPRKDQCITGLVEAAVEELFRDMMTRREEEDLVSGDKMQTGEGVAPGGMNETRAAAVSAQGGDAAPTGIEAGGGTPRMEESSAARSPETGDAASTGVKRKRGRPRKEKSEETGIKRPRGRPRKNLAATTSAETGDVASTVVKTGRGRKGDPPEEGKRSRGRPRKHQPSADEVLFRDMAETSTKEAEVLVSAEKTQAEGVVAPGDRKY